MLIDKIANSSSLKNINPIEKFFLTVGVLIFLLSTSDKLIFILNFLIFNFIILFIMKVHISNLIKLYIIPSFFILTTIISLVLIGSDVSVFLLRAFSSLSVVYFLVCSTPMTDFDYVFAKLKFPKIFRELFSLIYRYIFILFDNKDKILTAQKSRLGYRNYKASKVSFPILLVSIMKKSFYYSINSVKAVEARLGSEFIFYPKKYNKAGKEIFFIILILLINIFLVIRHA